MRPIEVPDTGLLCDLLWSDPEKEIGGWAGIYLLLYCTDNERGVSYIFGPDIIANFLKKNDMDLVCRAH